MNATSGLWHYGASRAPFAVAVSLAWAVQAAAADGRCIAVAVDSTIAFPDGSHHAAGELKLCPSHAGSPVQALHEIFVDGEAIGRLPSSRGRAEAATAELPVVIFRKLGDGSLVLVGYTVPDPRGTQSYRLVPPTRRVAKTRSRPAEPIADLVLAARLN